MERGWDAKGLLAPVWARVGGRDALAALAGVQPGTLSGYNTGRLRLGMENARKIAVALGVSVLELGAPEEEADAAGQSLVDRQAALEAEVLRLTKQLARLARRVAVLERQAPPGSKPARAAH